MTAKSTHSKTTAGKKTRKKKQTAPAETAGAAKGKQTEQAKSRVDPMESIWKSRERDREEMLQTRRELREMVQDSQLRILAMRTKGNLARLKLVNKTFDD